MLKQLHFPQGGWRTKCLFKMYHVIDYGYCTRQKSMKFACFVVSYINYSQNQLQCKQTGHIIRDSRHLVKLPKYHISLLTASIGLRFSFMAPNSNLTHLEDSQVQRHQSQCDSFNFHHFSGCSWWSVLNFFPSDFLGTFILRWSLGEASLLGEEKRAREKPLAQWERIQADYLLHQVWGRTKEEENAEALFLPHRALF